jgi:hypothetical protein
MQMIKPEFILQSIFNYCGLNPAAVLRGPLEEVLGSPFETVPLTLGKSIVSTAGGVRPSMLSQPVGRMKALIRIVESEYEEPMLPPELLDALLRPKGYKVRLYALRAHGLTPLVRQR